jgi:KUP system potassium uptake protein
MDIQSPAGPKNYYLLSLTIGALGVVYGDIGTSPLYALRECFNYNGHGVYPNPTNVLGVLSLIFWALIITISLEYVVFIMRADNRGEGGILALTALTLRRWQNFPTRRRILMVLGIFGAALFYSDGVITPAISVLSAVEGLKIASPLFEQYLIPITLVILIGLFMIQRRGTASVGAFFGPIMLLWFATLAILGFRQVIHEPSVLLAINPFYALDFFIANRWHGYLVLGSVVLVITGGEALYADMGHFGKKPIRVAWFTVVLPAILINYFGQGALLLQHPQAAQNPFFLLAPSWALYPLVILSTAATVIASQAVISGTFSLTRQAIQLGYCPRMQIDHTSEETVGQIYIPWVNWILLIVIIGLVLGFKSSSNLAAAYGIAVTGTMVITTTLAFVALSNMWGWKPFNSILAIVVFLSIDLAFFIANWLKIPDGGWFPILIGIILFFCMSTWQRGRELLSERMAPDLLPLDEFFEMISYSSPIRVPGTAVFMMSNPDGVPPALLHNLKHNKVLHERVVFLTIVMQDIPVVKEEDRVKVQPLGKEFYRVLAYYGFKEYANVPTLLEHCKPYGLEFEMMETTFFLSRETLIPSTSAKRIKMALWRKKIFITMLSNARSAMDFFGIPINRVIEIGTQVRI